MLYAPLGDQVEEGRLFELHRHALPQRFVKDRVARRVRSAVVSNRPESTGGAASVLRPVLSPSIGLSTAARTSIVSGSSTSLTRRHRATASLQELSPSKPFPERQYAATGSHKGVKKSRGQSRNARCSLQAFIVHVWQGVPRGNDQPVMLWARKKAINLVDLQTSRLLCPPSTNLRQGQN